MPRPDALNPLRRAYAALIDVARGEIAAGRSPDASALEARIRAVRLTVDGAAETAVVDRAERAALQQLERVLAVHRGRALLARRPAPPPPAPPPRRPRALLRSRPTVSGNMDVRRAGPAADPSLAWDPAPGVARWEIRFSERPDPRGDYVVRETLELPGPATAVPVPLGDAPLRIHLLGRSRDGRLVRRALISALTADTWADRWQRRASAS